MILLIYYCLPGTPGGNEFGPGAGTLTSCL